MPKKNFSLRVGVGDPKGQRSGIWRIWTQDASSGKASNSDVYVAARSVAELVKVSLHESGCWQYSLTSRYAAQQHPTDPRTRRHLERWQRPIEYTPGLTLAFRLYVPEVELRRFTDPELKGSAVAWLPAPPVGLVKEISLILGKSAAVANGWPGKEGRSTDFLARVPLVSGEVLWIVHRDISMSTAMSASTEEAKRRDPDDNFGLIRRPHPALRLALFGRHQSGCGFIVDVAGDSTA